MILDGYSIVEKKIVTFDDLFDEKEQQQPNGIDLRVGKIYQVQGTVTVPRDSKVQADLQAQEFESKDGYWVLHPKLSGLFYVDFLEKVDVPGGHCGIIHTRSSLVRSGIDVVAGVFDAGFTGQLGACLRVHSQVTIEYGARLAQLVVFESKFRGALYSGRYQNSNSQTAINS